MSFETHLKARVAVWLTSKTRLKLLRMRQEVARRLSGRGHEVYYFHRADDPYCQLMVQVLPDLAKRFNIKIMPLVVERLPANMYPDPHRFEAYAILDALRLAKLYGLGFPATATVPDRLAVGMANRYLVSLQGDTRFFSVAEELGEALWRGDEKAVRSLCVAADVDEEELVRNEKFLAKLGHYASATVYYGGEFYPGLDRLDHLERRLNQLGQGDGEVHFELTRLWRYGLDTMEKSVSGRLVELFFSVRSPYSYLSLQLASELAATAGVRLKLRPVLPMRMRGMPVPTAKGRYILFDTAREARLENIAFGRIVDPLGEATEKAMAVGLSLSDGADQLAFFKAFTKGVWSEGIDGTTLEGMTTILNNARLDLNHARRPLPEDQWRAVEERNRNMLLASGAWGVPTFRVGSETLWGQDRMWAVVMSLKQQ